MKNIGLLFGSNQGFTINRLETPIFIIVPFLNEASAISHFLSCIDQQTIRPTTLIMVDSGSSDNFKEIIEKESKNKSYNIQLIHAATPYKISFPGNSRNIGLKKVPPKSIIAFLDMGIDPQKDWLEVQINSKEFKRDGGVLGSCLFEPKGFYPLIICALSTGVHSIHPTLPGTVLTKELQLKVGMFAKHLRSTEDLLWKKKFLKITNQKKSGKGLIIYNSFANSLMANIKKYFLYAQYRYLSGIYKQQIFVYIFFLFICLVSLFYGKVFLFIVGTYILFRGILDPIRRSQKRLWFNTNILAFLLCPLVAFLLDISKFCGFLKQALRGN